MTFSSRFTAVERIHSLKFAILGGLCAGLVSVGWLMFYQWLILGHSEVLTDIFSDPANLTLLVNGAIATLSGALFALVYRYAVRQDKNLQLNMGVVTAFTLVRGLALVDVEAAIAQRDVWPLLYSCGENFLIFGLTALVLTLAMEQRWIAPFGESSEES
ncbi:MAG: hypothetical protein AAGD25_31260 [Cyanobacteria bacterium P01_F01_bin.150]